MGKVAKKKAKTRPSDPPFETKELEQSLQKFFKTPYIEADGKAIGTYKWGVYIFYDYDGEPIYVGQTKEKVSGRIRRHLTNQRTDAVAMSVLDPFEVCDIEIYPLPQFEKVNSKHRDFKYAKDYLDALENLIHAKAIEQSAFKAILNEKTPPDPKVKAVATKPLRGRVVSDDVFKLRSHRDARLARRTQIVSRLAQTISERTIKNGGLRRTLVVQAERIRRLAQDRFEELGGEASVKKEAERKEEKGASES